MITKNDIIKMAKHVTRRSSGKRDGRIIHPQREWMIGLTIATIMFLVGGIYTAYTFFTELHYEVDPSTVRVDTTSYEHALVKEALNTYRAKEEAFNALRGGSVGTSTQNVISEEEAEAIRDGLATTTNIRVE